MFCRPFGAQEGRGALVRGLRPRLSILCPFGAEIRCSPRQGRRMSGTGWSVGFAHGYPSSAPSGQRYAVRPVRGEGGVATGASPWNRPPPPSLKPRKGRQNHYNHGRQATSALSRVNLGMFCRPFGAQEGRGALVRGLRPRLSILCPFGAEIRCSPRQGRRRSSHGRKPVEPAASTLPQAPQGATEPLQSRETGH